MTFFLLALVAAFVAIVGTVLADSGLRLWSAAGGIARQQAALRTAAKLPAARRAPVARVVTRVSYAKIATQERAAA